MNKDLEKRVQELESDMVSLQNKNVFLQKSIDEIETTLHQLKTQIKCTCNHQTTHHPPVKIHQVV